MEFIPIKLILALLIAVIPFIGVANAPYGLERMEQFDQLPVLMNGTQVRQVSSHDRTGGNNDGFDGEFSALYIDENDEYVMFDEIGSGCLYRFWMTYGSTPTNYPDARLRFYFDDETVPRLDLSITEFFDGVGAPLEFPMVGNFSTSSHGCYCYLPFPYQNRLKITLSERPFFYNMTYHRFDSNDGVGSWTGSEECDGVLALWNNVGEDPKPTESNLVVSSNLTLSAGETGVLFSAASSGTIQSIKLDPSPATPDVLSDVWIQMDWDGGEWEVDVPLGDFFGSGKYEINVSSLPIGMKTSGDWYCYFPMPYWDSAEIRLVNKSGTSLSSLPFEIQYSTNEYNQAATGYFCAHFSEETFVENDRDFNFIDETGHGHVVGLSLFMESFGARGYRDMNYLEGDERCFIDGARSPVIHGTGLEDYFNCGWYFNQGTFSRPSHGHPWRDQFNLGETNYTQAYRMHLSDTIPFNTEILFGIEHGHWTEPNAAPGTFSSVAYFYKAPEHTGGMVPVCTMDLGVAWSEQVSSYQPAAGAVLLSNSWSYAGDNLDVPVEDSGYAFSGAVSSFRVHLPQGCSGLLVRRRTDMGPGMQKAQVFVDDSYAGTWYEADGNYAGLDNRWVDSEFMIASNQLAGKAEVTLSVVPLSSATAWNECEYRVFAMTPMNFFEDTDADLIPDGWEMETVGSVEFLSDHGDYDGDGVEDREEYIAGTSPIDGASKPVIASSDAGRGVRFATRFDRLYEVESTTSLLSNDWVSVRSDIPGTGNDMVLEELSETSGSFFRLKISNK